MTFDDTPDLGPCCTCGRADGVRNVVMLDRRGPVAGKGWGCVACGLPCDGALAVLCDACVDLKGPPQLVCAGYPASGRRYPYGMLSAEVFEHDASKHEGEA